MRVPPGKYPRVILSNVGNFIEYSEHSTALKLHRKDGESYKEITIPANTETDLHVELANLSANGKFIILAVTSKEDNREDRTKFRLYDANGNRIWEFIPEKKPYFFHPGVIGVSSDGSCGVVGLRTKTESVTYLLRKEGNVITKIPDCWPSQIKFSRSGEHVALVNSSQNRIILVETKTGKTYSVSVGPTLEEFDFAENGRLVGVTTARSVALLDFDGNWIWSMPIQLDTRSTNISMSPNGNEICVTSGNQYFVFKQNRLIR